MKKFIFSILAVIAVTAFNPVTAGVQLGYSSATVSPVTYSMPDPAIPQTTSMIRLHPATMVAGNWRTSDNKTISLLGALADITNRQPVIVGAGV